MTCDQFRAAGAIDTPELLEHLRDCNACMNFAAEQDGDALFRAIGGEDLIPPGGVDAFVADVVREVNLREKQRAWTRNRKVSPFYRWSAAAAVLMAIGSYALQHRGPTHFVAAPQTTAAILRPIVARPVVESYDNSSATIVEVPTSEQENTKIVMVFDDSLPADL